MNPYYPDPDFYQEGFFSEPGWLFRARHKLPQLPNPEAQEGNNA